MNSNDLKMRTKTFALAIIDLVEKMDYSIAKKAVAGQLVRSGTSVGANYRASLRARSDKEFVSKINIVLEEADESAFWLELVVEKKWADANALLNEANELTSIFVSTLKTMRSKQI